MSLVTSEDMSFSESIGWIDILAGRVARAYLVWRKNPTPETKKALDLAANEFETRNP